MSLFFVISLIVWAVLSLLFTIGVLYFHNDKTKLSICSYTEIPIDKIDQLKGYLCISFCFFITISGLMAAWLFNPLNDVTLAHFSFLLLLLPTLIVWNIYLVVKTITLRKFFNRFTLRMWGLGFCINSSTLIIYFIYFIHVGMAVSSV